MLGMLSRNQTLGTMAIGLIAIAVFVAIVALLAPRVAPEPAQKPFAAPAAPPVLATAALLPGTAGRPDDAWVRRIAAATGIPARALAAYAGAAVAKHDQMPQCGIGWNTLAAIGKVESDHGRHGGSRIGADGTVTPPIYGVRIGTDTDAGAVDGTAAFDRAAGPMQFIPEAWNNWATDANGDGIADVQNIDDAAMATANYLCRVSSAMTTPEGWRAAIAGYNSAPSYAVAVASAANGYATAAAKTH